MEWFYADHWHQYGPVSEEQLIAAVDEGKVRSNTLVWNETLPNWTKFCYAFIGVETNEFGKKHSRCCTCNRIIAKASMLKYQKTWVCTDCKKELFQLVAETGNTDLDEIVPNRVGPQYYAGFWNRLGAGMVDMIAWVVLTIIFGLIIRLLLPSSDFGVNVTMLFNLFVAVVYCAIMETLYGASLGKMAVGLRVVDDNRSPVTFWRAFIRAGFKVLFAVMALTGFNAFHFGRHVDYLPGWVTFAMVVVGWAGFIYAAFHPEKAAVYDVICRTRIMEKRIRVR